MNVMNDIYVLLMYDVMTSIFNLLFIIFPFGKKSQPETWGQTEYAV